jgi:hypothetical protein
VKVVAALTAAVRFAGIIAGIEGANVRGEFRDSRTSELSRWPAKNNGASVNPNTSTARVPVMGAKSLIWLLRILHADFPVHDLRFPSGPP